VWHFKQIGTHFVSTFVVYFLLLLYLMFLCVLNVPTPWRTIFEKPVVAHRLKKYPVFIEPEDVVLCSKGAASCPVVLASWIQPKSSKSVSLRGILFAFFHLRLEFQEFFKSKVLSALLSSCLSPICFACLVCDLIRIMPLTYRVQFTL
jgi:hypothetical protein